jgi:hypothetical protein
MTSRAARRRAALAAGLAATAVVVGGCTGTVSGHGMASFAPAVSGFPSSTPPAQSRTPSGGASSTPAPAGSTPAVDPSDRTTAVAGGVLVTSGAGHFRVVLPSEPTHTDEPGSFGPYSFTVHIEIATTPYIAIAEGEDVHPPLHTSTFNSVLRSVVSGFRTNSGMRLVRQSPTRFKGYVARDAIFEAGGKHFELLTFAYSGSRLYVLVAPQGRRFDALAASFVPLP